MEITNIFKQQIFEITVKCGNISKKLEVLKLDLLKNIKKNKRNMIQNITESSIYVMRIIEIVHGMIIIIIIWLFKLNIMEIIITFMSYA